jgi:hypothetical protein
MRIFRAAITVRIYLPVAEINQLEQCLKLLFGKLYGICRFFAYFHFIFLPHVDNSEEDEKHR